MASVFAGRMILEVILHSVKSAGAGEDVAPPPHLQTDCLHDGIIFKRPRNRVPKTQRTQGPEDQGTTGPEDQGTSRPRHQELGQTF